MTSNSRFTSSFAGLAGLALLSTGLLAASEAGNSLYERLGGKASVHAVVNEFAGRVLADEHLAKWFGHVAHDTHEQAGYKQHLEDFICQATGGGCHYTGKDMKAAHEGMGIRTSHFNALVEVLQQSMDARQIPFTVQNRMLARLAPMHRDIITK